MKKNVGLLVITALICMIGNANAAVGFNWIDLTADNRAEGWVLKISTSLFEEAGPPSTTVEYSWDGGNFYEMDRLEWGFYLGYYDDVSQRSGISPPSYFNGSIFTWNVYDPSGNLSAWATVGGIREVPLSTDLMVLSGGINPTISWQNDDYANLDKYRVRVLTADHDLLWQEDIFTVAQNPEYTISGYDFIDGQDYFIRVEAYDIVPFTAMGGAEGLLNNRSVVDIPYNTAVPIPGAFILLASGLTCIMARKKLRPN